MLINTRQSTLLALLIAVGLTGCQTPNGESYSAGRELQVQQALDRMGVVMGEQVNRISGYQVRSWNDINDTTLVVNTGLHDHYLVRLTGPCLGLSYAFSIGFSTTTRDITPFDDVVVEGLDGYAERCRIREIYRLDHAEEEAEAQEAE